MSQTALDRESEINAAWQHELSKRIDKAEIEALRENINADLTRDDVTFIAREMIAKPTWFPE